jgi:gp16 family phage-associated protein
MNATNIATNAHELAQTTKEIRAVFETSGISVAEWARVSGFSTGLVYQVLEGRRKCVRGQSHRIAVALGLKAGQAIDVAGLSEMLKLKRKSASEMGGRIRKEGDMKK